MGLRTTHLIEFTDWNDEVWSLWHVRGTLSEALSRVPADWPPLFSIITWAWLHVAGPKLEIARYMMVLLAALSAATIYQAALAWVLRHPHVIAIPKAADARHVRENRAAADLKLTTQDLAEIDAAFPPPRRKMSLEML